MKKILETISQTKKDTKNLSIVLICFFVLIAIYVYYSGYYVIVRFNELGSIAKNTAVYYNGFKVGKITNIEPDDDFNHTLVRVNLSLRKLNLPQNTTVYMDKFPSGEVYLKFIYPPSPSLKKMRRGSVLEGIAPYNLEEFMLGQNISGVTDIVSIHVIRALNATEIANIEMKNFFENTSLIVQDNRESIRASANNTEAMTQSLAKMAESLNQASIKLNNSIDSNSLKGTTVNVNGSAANIKEATANIKETTENISNATKDIGETMQKIDNAACHINATAANLNSMTSGLNETLSKRGGGMRLMFGTPIKPKN